MTDEHKAALAQGRADSRAVKAYLEVLDETRPKRGRKRTTESIEKRLAAIDAEFGEASVLKRLSLSQERIDLATELANLSQEVDISAAENRFVEVAKAYSESKGISYAAWRTSGVPADVLVRAGITRGS
ncbi:MAG: hypothetical protein JST73_12130 [Actinobacteria bacterium]|nr:hypothetical protein [Actinomycetota bacterium]